MQVVRLGLRGHGFLALSLLVGLLVSPSFARARAGSVDWVGDHQLLRVGSQVWSLHRFGAGSSKLRLVRFENDGASLDPTPRDLLELPDDVSPARGVLRGFAVGDDRVVVTWAMGARAPNPRVWSVDLLGQSTELSVAFEMPDFSEGFSVRGSASTYLPNDAAYFWDLIPTKEGYLAGHVLTGGPVSEDIFMTGIGYSTHDLEGRLVHAPAEMSGIYARAKFVVVASRGQTDELNLVYTIDPVEGSTAEPFIDWAAASPAGGLSSIQSSRQPDHNFDDFCSLDGEGRLEAHVLGAHFAGSDVLVIFAARCTLRGVELPGGRIYGVLYGEAKQPEWTAELSKTRGHATSAAIASDVEGFSVVWLHQREGEHVAELAMTRVLQDGRVVFPHARWLSDDGQEKRSPALLALEGAGDYLLAWGQRSSGGGWALQSRVLGPPGPGRLGEGCTEDTECESGHCVDGLCCASSCSDICMTCQGWQQGEWADTLGDGRCRTYSESHAPASCTEEDVCGTEHNPCLPEETGSGEQTSTTGGAAVDDPPASSCRASPGRQGGAGALGRLWWRLLGVTR